MTNRFLDVEVRGAAEAARAFRDERVLREPTAKMIRDEIRWIARTVERRTPRDTSRTAQMWRTQIQTDRAAVENASVAAIVLNSGRRPGGPLPPASRELRAWAQRRGIDERGLFAIRLAIAREGTRGTGYIDRTVREAQRRAPRAAREAARGIERRFQQSLGAPR